MRIRNQVYGFGIWFQLRHLCPAMMFPRNRRASHDTLGLPFFVVWENLSEHWSGNEIQTCNLRGRYKAWILNSGLCYQFQAQGPIRVWASWCHILDPYQAWDQGPIWTWVPQCRTSSIHRFSAKCTTSRWSFNGHWILKYAKTFKFLSDNDLGKTITSTKILARRFLKNYQEWDFNIILKDEYISLVDLK